jgi:PAS domain-containing protein
VLLSDETEFKQVEEELRTSEEHYRSLVNALPEAFYVADLIYDESGDAVDYRYLEANQAFAEHIDVPLRALVGRTALELLPDLPRSWIDRFAGVVLTGDALHFQDHLPRTSRYFDILAYRVQPGRFAVILSNITEARRLMQELERSEERFRLVVENLSEGLILLDAEGKAVYQNPASKSVHLVDLSEDGPIRAE